MRTIDTRSRDIEQQKQNIKYNINEQAYALSDLIYPNEVDEEANSWGEVDADLLEQESFRSAEIMLSERQMPYYGYVIDLAVMLIRADMQRVPRDDMANHFESDRDYVKEMYWPNDMDRCRVTELIQDIGVEQYPYGYLEDAHSVVMNYLTDAIADV